MTYTYEDHDDMLWIERSAGINVGIRRLGHPVGSVNVPPHRIREVCRALYGAAGLPLPNLSDVPDPEVVALTAVLYERCTHETAVELAREVIAAGWKRGAS